MMEITLELALAVALALALALAEGPVQNFWKKLLLRCSVGRYIIRGAVCELYHSNAAWKVVEA